MKLVYRGTKLSTTHAAISQFLPNIGRLVVDAIEDKLGLDLVKRFAIERVNNVHTLSRSDEPAKELVLSELCNPEDLLP